METQKTAPAVYVLAGAIALAMLLVSASGLLPDAAADTRPAPDPELSQSPTTADARELMDRVTAAYAKLQSLELRGTIGAELEVAGLESRPVSSFSASFRSPSQFRHETEGDVLIGGTEQMAYLYLVRSRGYVQGRLTPGGSTLRQMPSLAFQVLAVQDPSLSLALARGAFEGWMPRSANVTRLADVHVDQKPHPALHFVSNDLDTRTTLLVNPDTYLLRQVRHDMRQAVRRRDGTADVRRALLVIDYATTTTDAQVADEQFAWSPPPGSNDLSQVRARMGMGRGGRPGTPRDSAAHPLVGKPALDFTLPALDGKQVRLSDLKGSVVVLDFWATWCGPCVKSLPELDEVYREKAPLGLKGFAVNVGEDADKARAWAESRKLSIPVLLDKQMEVAQAYQAEAIPQTVIIGKDGIIASIIVGVGPEGVAPVRKAIEEAMAK